MSMKIKLNIAILTISDTRTVDNDKSGDILIKLINETHHAVSERAIVKDNIYAIRSIVSLWINNKDIDVVITTGGTGVTGTDGTPEAVEVLFDKKIDGFGEIFRAYPTRKSKPQLYNHGQFQELQTQLTFFAFQAHLSLQRCLVPDYRTSTRF